MAFRVALVAVFLAVAAAPAPAAVAPAVRVVRERPLTLAGTGFRARENLRVTVVMGEVRLARTTAATALGRFSVRFDGVRFDPCATPVDVVVRGARTGAVHALLPVRDCAMR